MNNPTNLSFYSQILLFKNDLSQRVLTFHGNSSTEQRALQSLSHAQGLEYEYSVSTKTVTISRPLAYGSPSQHFSNPDAEMMVDEIDFDSFIHRTEPAVAPNWPDTFLADNASVWHDPTNTIEYGGRSLSLSPDDTNIRHSLGGFGFNTASNLSPQSLPYRCRVSPRCDPFSSFADLLRHERKSHNHPTSQCWEHGCNGHDFSTHTNLLRHQLEMSGIIHNNDGRPVLTEQDRKRICQYHEDHPHVKQSEIGGRDFKKELSGK